MTIDWDKAKVSGDPQVLPAPKAPMQVARVLLDDRYGHPRGVHLLRWWRASWWQWRTSHWAEVEEASIRSEAYRFTEQAVYVDGKNLTDWAPNRYKIHDLLDALRALTLLPERLQPPVWTSGGDHPSGQLVACANGLLEVATRTLHPHHPAYFNVVAVPFDYEAGAATPVRWQRFLTELWPDDSDAVAALAEFAGYVLSGRTDLHKILLLIGPTRAGKGVIGRILKELVGKGNAAGPTLASMGTNFGLSPLIGKPLAIVSDARLGGANVHQVVERLLSVSGEDMLTIDRKYQEPWTGTLPTRFLVISNELPRFGDASGAISNRFIVLALHHSWLGKENTSLTRELTDELAGILNWALDGLDRLNVRNAFTEPASSVDAIVALQDLVSPVAAFVRDCCEVGPGLEVGRQELYAAWKSWCEDNGRDRPGTVQVFGRDLRAVLPSLSTVRPREGDTRVRRYRGLTLSTAHNGRSSGPPWTTSTETNESAREPSPVHAGPQDHALWAQGDDVPELVYLPVDEVDACRVCRATTVHTDTEGAICPACHAERWVS